jgi:hypothetical protein
MIIGLSGKKRHGKNLAATIIQLLIYAAKKGYDNRFVEDCCTDANLDRDLIATNSGWEQVAFGHKIKRIASLVLGLPIKEIEFMKEYNHIFPTEWNDVGDNHMTMRTFLQKIGTEALRNTVHRDFWINALFSDYRLVSKIEKETMITADATPIIHSTHRYKIAAGRIPGLKVDVFTNEPTYSYNQVSEVETFPNWLITDVRFPNELEAIKNRASGRTIRIYRPDEGSDTHESETALDNQKEWDAYIVNDGSIADLIFALKETLKHFKILL